MTTGSMEQLYQQVILDHARAPHGRGLGDEAGHEVVARTDHDHCSAQSHQVNPTCGDEVTLRVRLAGGPGPASVVEEIRWEGQGCSISQASLSVLTELVTGRDVAAAEHLGEVFRELMRSRGRGLDPDAEDLLGDAAAFTGVARYPARIKCALLGWAALRDAFVKAGAVTGASTQGQETA